jgi:hypothetical protein
MTAESELTQSERRATLLNDVRVQQQKQSEPPATMHAFAVSEIAAERQLRDGALTPSTVVGSVSPPHTYPRGPDWTVDPVGAEPNLGFDVNAMQPTGEAFEVQRSLEAQHLPPLEPCSSLQGAPAGSVAASPECSSSAGVERTGPAFSNKD